MKLGENNKEQARSRIGRLFRFLQELHKIRQPPTKNLNEYDWCLDLQTLPKYSTIQIGEPPKLLESGGSESSSTENDFVLKVKRPKETPCPQPEKTILEWLKPGWQQFHSEPDFIPAKNHANPDGKTITVLFEEAPERVFIFQEWIQRRKKWKEAELPVREAAQVFSDLFELWGKFQRESEKFQLYLADGTLLWEHPNGQIRHPLLLQAVQIEFEPSVPEFTIRETEHPPELYSALLRTYGVDGSGLQRCREMVNKDGYHPLAGEETSGFLRYVVQRFWQDGEFFETEKTERSTQGPCIYRNPVIFLGYRNQGFVEAIEAFLEAIPKMEELPEALIRLVGFETRVDVSDSTGLSAGESPSALSLDTEVDLLLTRPANPEQERVIRRLEAVGSVLVQGPPGTGKSHTIANLVGHLLAQNKTVLISSQTSKALKVVREKVAKPIQPLCVSVLDSDEESRKQLEESISGIVNYFSVNDRDKLASEIKDLGNRREELKKRKQSLVEALTSAMREEYTDIVIAGEGTPPSQAARKLVNFTGKHDWIPGPIVEGAVAPLSTTELAELYATNQAIHLEDERILASPIPDIDKLPNKEELTRFVEESTTLEKKISKTDDRLWRHRQQVPEHLSALLDKATSAVSLIDDKNIWALECIESGRKGGSHREPWDNLVGLISKCQEEIAKRNEKILSLGPKVELSKPIKDLIRICSEIIQHLESGGKLNVWSTLFRSEWKNFVEGVAVYDGPPKDVSHFHAILAHLEVSSMRDDLRKRWDRQMGTLGALNSEQMGERPEEVALQYKQKVQFALEWHQTTWVECEQGFEKLGINWNHILGKVPPNPSSRGELFRIRDAILDHLGEIIHQRINEIRLKVCLEKKAEWISYLSSFSEKSSSYPLISSLRSSVEHRDYVEYASGWTKLNQLTQLNSIFHRRYELLRKLEAKAPGWSLAIQNRHASHKGISIPGDAEQAWKYRQWDQTIERRNQTDLDSLQRELNAIKDQLEDVTGQYVEKLAWSAQWARTGLREQQALQGWLGIQKKIGAGTGKRVPRLRAEARKLLRECRDAVPVWIMPMSRVLENFDISKNKFDVVILDEASQSDVLGLVAFAIGKEVVVVGDHEQVSPYAVGQDVLAVQALIDEMLKDIPNKQLYDGKTSVYDLARQSFGGTIRLVEHFRCVPDIIQFSNFLCYNGEIKALREANSSHLYPHLVAYRLTGCTSTDKLNEKEANVTASLVVAMCEQPEYAGLSIGVISLVGTDQSLYIESILRRRISLAEYQQRKLVCGNAAQFQGDERDVMLLSVVDSAGQGPLSLRQADDYRKSFNVAASRARDQLWVVHSLNPDTDLKAGDLRLRLIKHAEDPSALRKQYETGEKRTDSEFERLVLGHLTHSGYRVVCQWEVGAFSIDMVVIGKDDRKVAIECDGDRYHPQEKLAEDMGRQMILERLGWRFIRIRGSEFFRDQQRAMIRVLRRLGELGIEPIGAISPENDGVERSTELKERVIRRAEEIRKNWEETPVIEEKDESNRRGRRWNKRKGS